MSSVRVFVFVQNIFSVEKNYSTDTLTSAVRVISATSMVSCEELVLLSASVCLIL